MRKEWMKTGQGGDSPFGPGEKSDDRLSRMLGRGLAEATVLVLDGCSVPIAIEKVAVTDPLAEVAVED